MLAVDEIKRIGIHALKEHQRLIATLIIALGNLYRAGKIQLEPLPETMLNEDQTSPVPDIMLFDNERDETPIIIEIAHGTGVNNAFRSATFCSLILICFFAITEFSLLLQRGTVSSPLLIKERDLQAM